MAKKNNLKLDLKIFWSEDNFEFDSKSENVPI